MTTDARCNGNVIPQDSRKDTPSIGQKIPGGSGSALGIEKLRMETKLMCLPTE